MKGRAKGLGRSFFTWRRLSIIDISDQFPAGSAVMA